MFPTNGNNSMQQAVAPLITHPTRHQNSSIGFALTLCDGLGLLPPLPTPSDSCGVGGCTIRARYCQTDSNMFLGLSAQQAIILVCPALGFVSVLLDWDDSENECFLSSRPSALSLPLFTGGHKLLPPVLYAQPLPPFSDSSPNSFLLLARPPSAQLSSAVSIPS